MPAKRGGTPSTTVPRSWSYSSGRIIQIRRRSFYFSGDEISAEHDFSMDRRAAELAGGIIHSRKWPAVKMPVNFEAVRKYALTLAGVEEVRSYGTPEFKVSGELFAQLKAMERAISGFEEWRKCSA
jgi:hypothetical protein